MRDMRWRSPRCRSAVSNGFLLNGSPATKIGQKNIATLQLGGAVNHSINSTQWTVTGERIKGFDVYGGLRPTNQWAYGPTQDRSPSNGQRIVLSAQDLRQPEPSWYWWKPGDQTVTCEGTITVDGENYPFRATREIKAVGPNLIEFNADPSYGIDPQGYRSTFERLDPPKVTLPSYQISSIDYRNVQQPGQGIPTAYSFLAEVSAPAEVNMSGDRWFFQQLVKGRERRDYVHNKSGAIDKKIVEDAGFELDGTYVYGAGGGYPLPTYDVGIQATNNDSPSIRATISLPNYTIRSFEMNLQARLYVMYRPSGVDSIPVPIARRDWSWAASATDPWPLTDATSLSTLSPSSLVPDYDLPEWLALSEMN